RPQKARSLRTLNESSRSSSRRKDFPEPSGMLLERLRKSHCPRMPCEAHESTKAARLLFRPPMAREPEGIPSRCFLQAVGGRLDHCTVEHAVSEVGEDDRGGLLEQDFLPPLLEARQKEARARGDRADTASWAQHLDAALDERRVHVILCSWVGLLEVFLGARAA